MRVLVCGGAGYVGAHVLCALHGLGHEVTTLDNLSTGHRQAVRWGSFAQGDILDRAFLDTTLERGKFDAVMHLCAKSIVSESSTAPYEYYENNVQGTLNVLRAMRDHGVGKFVFSSSAAVYGSPRSALITEDHPKAPLSAYGASKLMVERILEDAAGAYGLSSTSLRYFNAAGADPGHLIGESHSPETHLIPNLLRSLIDPNGMLDVFGQRHPTPDGTCVRDFVHVRDLAAAHVLALEHMSRYPARAHAFNLGSGTGFSVVEVIRAAEQLTGKMARVRISDARPGDPATLVASSQKAKTELGWQPMHTSLESIIRSAWEWHLDPDY